MSAISTGTAVALASTIGAGTSVAGSLIGAHAANKAAQTQSQAAQQAENLQQQEWQAQQANLAPWVKAGTGALGQLSAGTQPGGQYAQGQQFQPYGSALNALNPGAFQPYGSALNALNPGGFQAPTAEQAAATPGYQFQFDQGLQALQRSQAATGITGGGAAKAAEQFGQGLASTNYQNAYNNALTQYQTNLGAGQGALANQLGLYGTGLGASQSALANQTGLYGTQQSALQNAYNRVAGIAGLGSNALSQLNAAGQNYASNVGNLQTSAGAAQAAGQVGGANAWAQGLGGVGNAAMQGALYNSIFNKPAAVAPNAFNQWANSTLAGPVVATPYAMPVAPQIAQSSYNTQLPAYV
jgi:hypothetical protein